MLIFTIFTKVPDACSYFNNRSPPPGLGSPPCRFIFFTPVTGRLLAEGGTGSG